jgi:hypothetical protein
MIYHNQSHITHVMRKENLRGMLKDTKATIFENCDVLLKMSNGKMLRE